MRSKIWLVLLCSLLFIPTLEAQEAPKTPYIQHDVCPFECCQYGEWIARSELTALQKEDSKSDVAFTIRPGEKFTALSGNVHVVKLGAVVLKKSFGDYVKGDKVYLLSYRGEGVYDIWYKGKKGQSDDYLWENGDVLGDPEIVWWVYVINKDGKKGWLKLKNISKSGFKTKEKIEGLDSCS